MQPERRDEYLASLALRNSGGLGPRTWKRLLEHFGRAVVAVEHAGQWHDLGLARKNQVREFLIGSWRTATDQEARAAQDKGMEVLLWSDPDYPTILRRIPNPPALLYLTGDRGLLGSPALALVGSRKCSRYGMEAVRSISREVSRAGICVVSGFAAGIDRQAHVSALEEIGSSIAVLGTGLDLLYPAANKDLWLRLLRQGLIVTEFAPGTRPDAVNFPHRNRIISGLSLGVLVVEAAVRSGSLITASIALEQGREVFALPGPVNMESYDGCHHLIRQGATLVRTVEDILTELRPQLVDARAPVTPHSVSNPPTFDPHVIVMKSTDSSKDMPGDSPMGPISTVPPDSRDISIDERTFQTLNPDEQRLVNFLEHRDKVHIDDICNGLDGEPSRVSTLLLLLEMRSLVMRYPGMYYSLCGR
ncbi:DNA-processing protein DprA [Desulfonatronum sp. SC1]|uniref:DNA-processing protein DprA n=1 Tax=Desulfonatronum sp. SC1 TaxID=2109626 RepID=UPI000D308E7D|nr:DNA-processing protein DprA [Desulfonatronum sp. SC1]PTN38704.1 DNA-protecting protein DprA [Desulfonatronum sp. SC1]